MLPVQDFPPSLHPLSVLQGVSASVRRTPRKPAIVEGAHVLTYAELGQAIAGARVAGRLTNVVVGWLASAWRQRAVFSEDDSFVETPAPLSHRTVVLRLLNISVTHPVFSRDTVSAVPLALDRAVGVTAAIAPLWLGGSLHLFEPGDAASVCAAIADGAVNQAWLGAAEFEVLGAVALARPPHEAFRGGVCAGFPPRQVSAKLLAWLGPRRIAAMTGDDELGPVWRHAGLAQHGECYPGVMVDETWRLSSLTAQPALPVWKEVRHAG